MHTHGIMFDGQGQFWELIDTEVFSRDELERMSGNFVNSPATIHFIMHEEFEIETDEIFDYAAGTSPPMRFIEGH